MIFSGDGLVYKFKDLGNPKVKLTSAEPKALVQGIIMDQWGVLDFTLA